MSVRDSLSKTARHLFSRRGIISSLAAVVMGIGVIVPAEAHDQHHPREDAIPANTAPLPTPPVPPAVVPPVVPVTTNLALPVTAIDRFQSEIHKQCGDENKNCAAIVKQITDAANLWVKIMSERECIRLPDLDWVSLVLEAIAYEAVLDPNAKPSKESQYGGLGQFSRTSGTFKDIEPNLIRYFATYDEARAQVPGLSNASSMLELAIETILGPSRAKTGPLKTNASSALARKLGAILGPSRGEAEPLETNEVFLHVALQTTAFLFDLHRAYTIFSQNPDFAKLPLPYIRAEAYLHHQNPTMANLILSHYESNESVRVLAQRFLSEKSAKKQLAQFRGNSGIYTESGDATPPEVLHRVAAMFQVAAIRIGIDDPRNAALTLPKIPPMPETARQEFAHAGTTIAPRGKSDIKPAKVAVGEIKPKIPERMIVRIADTRYVKAVPVKERAGIPMHGINHPVVSHPVFR